MAAPSTQPGADTEAVPRARRRRFSKADKRRILGATDRCTQPGEIDALLRRENERLKSQLDKARLAIEVQKNCRIAPE